MTTKHDVREYAAHVARLINQTRGNPTDANEVRVNCRFWSTHFHVVADFPGIVGKRVIGSASTPGECYARMAAWLDGYLSAATIFRKQQSNTDQEKQS